MEDRFERDETAGSVGEIAVIPTDRALVSLKLPFSPAQQRILVRPGMIPVGDAMVEDTMALLADVTHHANGPLCR